MIRVPSRGVPFAALLALMLSTTFLPASAVGASKSAQHVVFMLDLSGSMKDRCTGGRILEIRQVRSQARKVLDKLSHHADADVTFVTFGNKDHIVRNADRVSVDEAASKLDAFFDDDCTRYGDQRTYIAYSIFEIVKSFVGAPTFTTRDAIPDDDGQFWVLVYTDGKEDTDKGFDNNPYLEWLRRHEKSLQIRWKTWDINDPLALKAILDALGPDRPAARDRVRYSVRFNLPTQAATFNPAELPGMKEVAVSIPRIVRLYPEVMESAVFDGARMCPADGEVVPAAAPGSEMHVQAEVLWGDAGVTRTGEWPIQVPPRGVVDGRFERSILTLQIGGDARVVLPNLQIQDGDYALKLVQDRLCSELRRALPDSDFIFPVEDDGSLQRLGTLTIERVPTLTLVLNTQEGVAPDQPMLPLIADRFHRFASVDRTFVLTAPSEVQDAEAEFSFTVARDGQPLEDARDFAVLAAGNERGAVLTARKGSPLKLELPAKPQERLASLIGLGFFRPAGTYDVLMCVRPRVTAATKAEYRVALECQGCDPSRVSRPDGRMCVSIPLEVKARPLSWIALALIALAVLAALRVWWRWRTRPQFKKGIRLGQPVGGADLRSMHGAGLRGMLSLYLRRPLYVELKPDGSTVGWRKLPDARKHQKMNFVALRPSPAGLPTMLLWCAAVERTDGAPSATVSFAGSPMQPQVKQPPAGSIHTIRFNDIDPSRDFVVLFRNDSGNERKYPLRITD